METTDRIIKRYTPRELIYKHMNNPHEPITDEDMENLILLSDHFTLEADTLKVALRDISTAN